MADKKNKDNNHGFLSALKEREARIVHLTHNDLDAAGCDSIHRIKYGKVFTIWSSVGKFSSNLSAISKTPGKGDLLSISDIGYHKKASEALKTAKENGWKIEWRDHHRWSDDELAEIEKKTDYLCVDTSVCATGIVARDLMPDDKFSQEIAEVVCDYDLWKHEIPTSKILGEVCTKYRNLNIVRDCFTDGCLINDEIKNIHKLISEEKDTAIKKSLKNTKKYQGRYTIAFAPLYGYPSETAHAIRENMNTDIEVIVSEKGKFSIRSVPPVSHIIAKSFNGGGHPPAAGGSFNFSFADRMAFLILRKNRHYKKLIEVAEKIKEE